MWIKRLLLILPLFLIILLLQSYFWVPTFDDQRRGNPERLVQFINAGIGDAHILNPILSADTASGTINAQIFEGLLDLDEDLNLRGRLATSWKIYAEIHIETDEGLKLKKKIASNSKNYEFLENIKSLEVTEGKLKITLPEVDPEFPGKLRAVFPEIPPGEITQHPVILFHLRRGVRWHDGKPFTARDVRFTYEAIMETANRSPRIPDFEPVKSVTIIDDYTIKVTYERLYSPAIYAWMIGIIPEHLLGKEALRKEAEERGKDPALFTLRDANFNRNPVGLGPFKFKEWKSDQYIRLIRNEDYWEGAPNFHQYVYRVLPDLLTQELMFYAGAIDSYAAQPHQVARLEKDERFQSFSGLAAGFTYIGWNLRRELFKDRRVRQALSMALDIPQIIEHLLYGQAEQTTGPFARQSPYYNRDLRPIPYNPGKAARILKELGWRRNEEGWLEREGQLFQFTLITNAGNETRKAIATIAQNSWREIGIKVSVDIVEWAVFLEKHIYQRNFDAVVLGWSLGIVNPDLYQIWHSSQAERGLNFVGYHNPLADELIVKIREEYNRERQIEYARRLHEIIYEDQPYTFLYAGKWTVLLDRRIVILEREGEREIISRIRPTKTGDYSYFFNRWIKLEEAPVFTKEM